MTLNKIKRKCKDLGAKTCQISMVRSDPVIKPTFIRKYILEILKRWINGRHVPHFQLIILIYALYMHASYV